MSEAPSGPKTAPLAEPASPALPYRQEGKDMWQRARTNALAQRLAAEHFERFNLWLAVLTSLMTVVPILAVSLSLHYLTSGDAAAALPLGLSYRNLALIAIGANALGLFLGFVGKDLRLAERASQHRFLLSSYSIIAQKARRLDSPRLSEDDANRIYWSLQETFEICKSSQFEPSDKIFRKAREILRRLDPLPFGLTPGA